MNVSILEWARKVQAIAQNGLAFSRDPYDRERYEQLQELVASILSVELKTSAAEAKAFWRHEEGYATPKIDVRGAVFVDNKVLLVQEHSDGKWTLPGGWADINDSPSEAVTGQQIERLFEHYHRNELPTDFD